MGTTLTTASEVVVFGGVPTDNCRSYCHSINASLSAASFSAGCGLQNTRRGTEHRVVGRLSKKRSVLEGGGDSKQGRVLGFSFLPGPRREDPQTITYFAIDFPFPSGVEQCHLPRLSERVTYGTDKRDTVAAAATNGAMRISFLSKHWWVKSGLGCLFLVTLLC